MSVRLGLDVADELEEMGIYDASTMTVEDTRLLIGRATTQLEEEEAAEAEATKAAEEAEVGCFGFPLLVRERNYSSGGATSS